MCNFAQLIIISSMKNRVLHIILFVFATAFYANAQQVTPTELAKFGSVSPQEEKVPQVQIVALNGSLTIKAEEDITKVEVYSPIGGLLQQSSAKGCEIKIDNLPKTILVVRIKIGDNKPIVQKVKMQ
jgi:hypothetical protein